MVMGSVVMGGDGSLQVLQAAMRIGKLPSICKRTSVSLVTIRPNHTLGTSELPDELTFLALSAVPTVPRDVDTVRIMHNGRRCG